MNQTYKNAALAALKGNWAAAVVATIVMYAVCYLLMGPYFATTFSIAGFSSPVAIGACLGVSYVGMFFLMMPLYVGVTYTFNQLLTDGDARLTSNMFGNAFDGYLKNVWAMFLYTIFIFLWSLLFLIPGIIKAYAYSMTPYILKDNPELSANEAINLSCKMMKGHKFDLFLLHLSFIGWCILNVFTFGIGMLWLMPYMTTAQAAFYQDIKKDFIK